MRKRGSTFFNTLLSHEKEISVMFFFRKNGVKWTIEMVSRNIKHSHQKPVKDMHLNFMHAMEKCMEMYIMKTCFFPIELYT